MIIREHETLLEKSVAWYSDCERYRYRLTREWDRGPKVAWLLLNPSTATEIDSDPTVTRCERRARSMGFAGLAILNLFAFRATEPADMKAQEDPVGPENDATILNEVFQTQMTVCGWGNHGGYLGRSRYVLDFLAGLKHHLRVLKMTSQGHPYHPLYVGYDVQPVPFPVPFRSERTCGPRATS